MSEESNSGRCNTEIGPSPPRAGKTKADYAVGYGKPPKATRFKKGQSGNPNGSKKKQDIDDMRIVIENVLAEPVQLRDGGKLRTISKIEAMLRVQRMNALKGDPKAAKALFKLGQKTGLFSQARPEGFIVLDPPGSTDEKMILRAFHDRQDSLNQPADATIERFVGTAGKPSTEH